MKRLVGLILLMGAVSGCATPLIVDNGAQSRVFIPCANDSLCIRDSYSIAWDYTCSGMYPDYPISHRSKQSEYQSDRVEFILTPLNRVEYMPIPETARRQGGWK